MIQHLVPDPFGTASYRGEQTLKREKSAIRRRFVRRLFRILNQALSLHADRARPGKTQEREHNHLAFAAGNRHLLQKAAGKRGRAREQ